MKAKTKLLQVAFVHDHTASMGGLRVQVRRNNCATITELEKFCAENGITLEVGVITITDLHDTRSGRDMIGIPLTRNTELVKNHIRTVPDAVPNSSGEECYERVNRWLRDWNWNPDAMKVVVATGDSIPHPRNHFKNPERLDCLEEARLLVKETGVTIYTVQALPWGHHSAEADAFWGRFADVGNGVKLDLDQFEHITPLLIGIAAREFGNLDAWQKEYEAKHHLSYAVQRSLDKLGGRKARSYRSRNTGKKTATAGRFQVYEMEERISAAQFFVQLGICVSTEDYPEHKGELFYAHESRPTEQIRPMHEVIIEDDDSAEKIFGHDARDMIGIPYGTKKAFLKRNFRKDEGYTVWIQTKSVGKVRMLEVGQRVMVDLNPSAGFNH